MSKSRQSGSDKRSIYKDIRDDSCGRKTPMNSLYDNKNTCIYDKDLRNKQIFKTMKDCPQETQLLGELRKSKSLGPDFLDCDQISNQHLKLESVYKYNQPKKPETTRTANENMFESFKFFKTTRDKEHTYQLNHKKSSKKKPQRKRLAVSRSNNGNIFKTLNNEERKRVFRNSFRNSLKPLEKTNKSQTRYTFYQKNMKNKKKLEYNKPPLKKRIVETGVRGHQTMLSKIKNPFFESSRSKFKKKTGLYQNKPYNATQNQNSINLTNIMNDSSRRRIETGKNSNLINKIKSRMLGKMELKNKK